LVERFAPLFHAYAAARPLPAEGATADARAFLRFVLSQPDLTPRDRRRLLSLRVRWGPPLRLLVTRTGIALAVRCPRGRVRCWGVGTW
jgi:hypothetical protein